jgi:hypothetical protein
MEQEPTTEDHQAFLAYCQWEEQEKAQARYKALLLQH